jgi:4-hydroxy-3-polyprenylbenzoate decarboxylase
MDLPDRNRKIVLAITGASGSIYAYKLLERLNGLEAPLKEIAVIFSETGKEIWESEIGSEFHNEGSAK